MNASSRNKLEEIREEGEVGEYDVGEHLQQSPPINLQDIHMLYGDEGFEEDSNKLENWEDELEFLGVESMYPFYGILFCSRLYYCIIYKI